MVHGGWLFIICIDNILSMVYIVDCVYLLFCILFQVYILVCSVVGWSLFVCGLLVGVKGLVLIGWYVVLYV